MGAVGPGFSLAEFAPTRRDGTRGVSVRQHRVALVHAGPRDRQHPKGFSLVPLLAVVFVMRRFPAVLLLLISGCSPYVHSPPGRTFPLESSKALYPRETGLQFEGGGTTGADVGVPGFSLRVRHGIVKQLDGSAEFNFSSIRPDGNREFVDANQFLMTGRIGVKYAIIDHVAITGGVAVGGWAGGAFVSPDLSLIVAYENPKAVPFFSGGGWTSHPFNEKAVRLSAGDSSGSPFFGVPVLTWGWTASAGLRIPVVHDVPPHSTPPSFLFGISFRARHFRRGLRPRKEPRRAKVFGRRPTSPARSVSSMSSRQRGANRNAELTRQWGRTKQCLFADLRSSRASLIVCRSLKIWGRPVSTGMLKVWLRVRRPKHDVKTFGTYNCQR